MIKELDEQYLDERMSMVRDQLMGRDIRDDRVLAAFRQVPRHLFVLPELAKHAYDDCPLPTLAGQTISQPYIVALMTQLLELPVSPCRILEIGTGSGYQAAILSYLGHSVISIERLPELAEFAKANLIRAGLTARILQADGSIGFPDEAPYDRIIVTAAAPQIPAPLRDQLVPGGTMVLPSGSLAVQHLQIIHRLEDGSAQVRQSIACAFVPLRGQEGFATLSSNTSP